MQVLSEEEYIDYYNTNNRFPNSQYSSPTKKYNSAQLKSKYQKYLKSEKKREERSTRQVERQENKEYTLSEYQQSIILAEEQVLKEDPTHALFWSVWTEEEKETIKQGGKLIGEYNTFDPMHIISRSQSRKLACDPLNIIYGARYFHTCIDSYINPFTKKNMSKEERDHLWIRLIGIERFNWLQSNK